MDYLMPPSFTFNATLTSDFILQKTYFEPSDPIFYSKNLIIRFLRISVVRLEIIVSLCEREKQDLIYLHNSDSHQFDSLRFSFSEIRV